jgi:transglutaminase-like putative cysteine protease
MLYDVRQKTLYKYGTPVSMSRHVVRLMPVDRPGQRVLTSDLSILPAPAERSEHRDFFGNLTIAITFEDPHDRLVITSRARIDVDPEEPPLPGLTPGWQDVRARAAASAQLGGISPVHALFPSRMVPLADEITDYAAQSFEGNRAVLAGAMHLMHRIRRDFTYKPGATEVTTSPLEAFARKEGVCQDFAHVMIAGLRGVGLPAYYVSGYLRTIPPPGRPRLEGADATHAWVSIWCGPEIGYIGLDPTNNIIANSDHILLAIGRDYADVAPVDGVIVASAPHTLSIAVDVVPVGSEP